MAVTQNTYTGNGSTTLYSFTFPYLEEDEIKVTLNGTLTTAYTLANATTISFTTAPANGVAIRIYRDTNVDNLQSTFFAGSAIRAQDLNNNFLQSNYSVQEIKDRYLDRTGGTMSGNLAMGGYKVTGLGAPTASADAVTKSYVDGYINTTYLGPSATDPATRPGGSPLQVGDQYFNTNQNILKAWTGTVWVISAAAGSIIRWRKTASAGNTTLSGVDDLGITLSYVVGNEQVFLNGALQTRGVDYTAATGTSITFTPALLAGDVVELHAVQGYVSATVPDGSVGETKLAAGAVTSAKIADGTIVDADVNASAGIVASKLSFTQTGAGAVQRQVEEKLKDIVSVKDFGAVGDGVTNDTAAINAALATGKTVYFPQGIYMTTGAHVIGTNGQGIIGDGPWESIIKKHSGTSELLRVARLTNGCFVRELGFDCNALAGTGIRWKSHYSVLSNVQITNGVNDQWGLHLTGVNVSRFEGLTIEETGGCILIDQNNDTDPATTYSTLYSRFKDLWLVPKNTQALKIQGQAQDIVFDGIYIETASSVSPSPPAITLSSAGPISGVHFYNLGCEHNALQSTFIDITGTTTNQNDIYNICFRGGRLTSGFAGQDKPLIRANKVNNLIVDGLLFYCDQNLANRPHIELTDCTNVKVANNSVYSYPNDFIFIKDNGGCSWVTDDSNTRIRINASGGAGTNQWGLTGSSSNISSINSGMSQSFTNATKVTSTDYQLAPSIRAYRNSSASLAHNTATKWAFSTVDAGYDPSGCYNTSTYRFTPTVKGFYAVTIKGVIATGGANLVFTAQLYKNGSSQSTAQDGGTGGTNAELCVVHHDLIYMNGSTDYLEGYFYQYDFTSGASRTVQANAFFAVNFVRSV